MEMNMDRGNCLLCGQRRVLGCKLPLEGGQAPEFRCCACIDEHGVAPNASMAEPLDEDEPRNWWASIEPPSTLADVPAGFVEVESMTVCDGFSQEWFLMVMDPCHNYFSGFGAERVWPAGMCLAAFLLSRPCAGLRIVELGAGCCLPGMTLARHGALVTLTDVPWLTPLMTYNVEANFALEDATRPSVAPLRWGSDADAAAVLAEHGAPDLVIGADIVYRAEDFEALLSSVGSLGAREVLLSVVQRDSVVRDFLKRLELLPWEAELCGSGPGPLRNGQVLILRLRARDPPAAFVPTAVGAGQLPTKASLSSDSAAVPQGGVGSLPACWPGDREACQAALAKAGVAGGCWGAAPVA